MTAGNGQDESATVNRIRALNDFFRHNLIEAKYPNQVVLSAGVAALPELLKLNVLYQVMRFSDFNENNDPHGEHDCATITLAGKQFVWKIDYFDKDLQFGSPDPANPDVTARVLTICFPEER